MTPSCKTAATHWVMNDICPRKMLVPILYMTASPSENRIISGWNHDSISTLMTMSARMTATAIYSGACVSAISRVSSTTTVSPLKNWFLPRSVFICAIALSWLSSEPVLSYRTSIIVWLPSAL